MDTRPGKDAILRFVERHGVHDKDAVAGRRRAGSGKGAIARNRKGSFRKTIDLHGMDSSSAELALANAISDCKKRGITELLVIHGYGLHSGPSESGVLKKLVRDSLEFRFAANVRDFGPALPREGGEGATVVRLR
jgi:DNA-nicking Smr family endonuclease